MQASEAQYLNLSSRRLELTVMNHCGYLCCYFQSMPIFAVHIHCFDFLNPFFIVDRWKLGGRNFKELRNKGMKKVSKSSDRNWVVINHKKKLGG